MQNIAFFGTHVFATHILKALVDCPFINVCFVLTQPDRPVGRKQIPEASPVKQFADEHNISVYQPASLKEYSLPTQELDLIVVAQYGLLVPKHILEFPKLGTINVHTSLLPEYRGASPIQSAIHDGKSATGVTIMLMDEGLDTGPILRQQQVTIEDHDMFEDVEPKLASVGAKLLLSTIEGYVLGSIHPQNQDGSQATLCKKLTREDGRINWNDSTQTIYNTYRALTPWPGVWTIAAGKRLKLHRIRPAIVDVEPGKMMFKDDTLYIGTSDGSVEITELQPEGKSKMNAASFIHGYGSLENTIMEA